MKVNILTNQITAFNFKSYFILIIYMNRGLMTLQHYTRVIAVRVQHWPLTHVCPRRLLVHLHSDHDHLSQVSEVAVVAAVPPTVPHLVRPLRFLRRWQPRRFLPRLVLRSARLFQATKEGSAVVVADIENFLKHPKLGAEKMPDRRLDIFIMRIIFQSV